MIINYIDLGSFKKTNNFSLLRRFNTFLFRILSLVQMYSKIFQMNVYAYSVTYDRDQYVYR